MNIAEVFLYIMCVAMSGVCVYLYMKMKNE